MPNVKYFFHLILEIHKSSVLTTKYNTYYVKFVQLKWLIYYFPYSPYFLKELVLDSSSIIYWSLKMYY